VLGFFARPALRGPFFAAARFVRSTGIARLLAGGSRPRFLFGMLDATRPAAPTPAPLESESDSNPGTRGTVALFTGCVMRGLFNHVHDATRRTLAANGFELVNVPGQECCGALHLHAGDREGALRLAGENLSAFRDRADYIVVNSAGCGAMLREAGHLLDTAESRDIAARVRDVSELLAGVGPRAGAELPLGAAYDAPCHLQHAQGVHAEVLQLLSAVPGLRIELLEGHDQCCGSAGIFSLLQPEMSRRVLERKIGLMGAGRLPDLILTGNPGCLMQIGAGLLAAGLPARVAHPVEVLDWSYRAAGYYGTAASTTALPVPDPQHA
ncbi:MAG: (Fe-S)-binding protein, partial [Gemmatimonadales bacterium]